MKSTHFPSPQTYGSLLLGATSISTLTLAGLPLAATAQAPVAITLDREQASQYLDIRGVGDSGMALTNQQPFQLNQMLPGDNVPADFGKSLDRLDPTQKSYRGDLTFINWETAVGKRCNRFWAPPTSSTYSFMSHPDNLKAAVERGFNLIGLANNHSMDCPSGEGGEEGSRVSAKYMTQLIPSNSNQALWAGVALDNTQKRQAQVKTMTVKGKSIRVAFGSLYVGSACTYVTCISDRTALLNSLRDANADMRILALHSWDSSSHQELVSLGRQFIQSYKGDVVFGHGPHVWKPVTVVPSNSGRGKGVMFESLGNFIHPNLAAKRQDMIGRALFDLNTLQLRQVQAIPLNINGPFAKFEGAPPAHTIPTRNLQWWSVRNANWQSGVNPAIQGVYADVK